MHPTSSGALGAITPAQSRAARALLAWSQQDLATHAGVGTSTVADFERGQRTPIAQNAEAIRGALEAAGIAFREGGAVIGPPLPALPQNGGGGSPIRWVDATDLAQWAERRDGQDSMPTLLAKLARAARPMSLQFPSDEGVQYSGWDGITEASEDTEFVPAGTAGWEIGSQRDRIATKATDDFNKRAKDPLGLKPDETTFVFVTPRHWPEKAAWLKARRAENIFRDVRAYDGTNLVHWIELYPAIGLWLAIALGKRPVGALDLREHWLEWSLATRWPLSTELLLSDRDESATRVLRWLREPSSVLAVKGESPEEVSAFFYSAITQLPQEIAEHYLCRCLVAASPEMARLAGDSATPLIIVVLDPEPGLVQLLAKKGHHVLAAYGQDNASSKIEVVLERPSRESIEVSLHGIGVPPESAKSLARESARSLSILRRQMPGVAGRLPRWAQEAPSQSLLASLLAGGWDESNEGDRTILSRLADMPYEQFVAGIAGFAGNFDSPLRRVGSTWKLASPRDAWGLLARHLSTVHVERFAAVAFDVLSATDPRFEMSQEERWYAPIRGVHPQFSEHLRHGIGEVLILLALFGSFASSVPSADRLPDGIVRDLLDGADRQRWWSLSRDFRLLAEASPLSFLSALDDALVMDNSPVAVLFGQDDSPLFGTEHLSPLLWALEALAWSPDYLGRVASILAALDEIDPGGRYTNRPGNSLKTTFLLWAPQTHATLEQRLRVLDRLRLRFPKAAWKLMLAILPKGHDSFSPAPTPRWRDFYARAPEVVTYAVIEKGALAVIDRLLVDVSTDVSRWEALLDRWANLGAKRGEALQKLKELHRQITNEDDRRALRTKLRAILHHNRNFSDAAWALPEEELAHFQEIYDSLNPHDPIGQVSWLFETSAAVPNPVGGWSERDAQLQEERRKAVENIFRNLGVDGVFALVHTVQEKGFLGIAVAEADLGVPTQQDEILLRALMSEGEDGFGLARGIIFALRGKKADGWAEALLAQVKEGGGADDAILTILLALPVSSGTWLLAGQIGAEIEAQYWRKAPILLVDEEPADTAFALNKLIEVGRARHAVHLVGLRSHNGMKLDSNLLVRVLREAAQQPIDSETDSNEATMFQHYVAEIFADLDKREDLDANDMLMLEWMYLPLLEYSQRPAKLIMRELASNPQLFVEMISAIYKPSDESGVADDVQLEPERAKILAHKAFDLLRLWDVVPGSSDDGTIDQTALEGWVREARRLARSVGREDIADQKIGEILACSGVGKDSIWPAEAVREVIESVRSGQVDTGVMIGRRNLRGVTTRLPGDGGVQEHQLVATYREWSRATALEWPRTSAILENIAKGYEQDARWHDDDAERLDWR
ncbi:helix-turn-helix domain-containing protein [Rhizobium etli]|nr:helix-turn-helix transcriptional regulator [Rhizobium etli]